MTPTEFKLLKPGDKVRVRNFSKFYNGKIATVRRVGSMSYNWHAKKQDYEIVTDSVEHACECGCKQSTRLALHCHNVESVEENNET